MSSTNAESTNGSRSWPGCWPLGLSAVICISEAVRANLLEHRVAAGNLRVIENGLDPAQVAPRSTPEDVRRSLGIDERSRVIGLVGNIKEWKGQEVVVRALPAIIARVPEVVCLFVGAASEPDRRYEARLRELISRLGLERHVVFTGYREHVADFLNVMEVPIHASILPEPFGRVLLEAMAMRKPMVGSRAGAVPEIIEHGVTGYTFAPGDSDELASYVIDLLERPVGRACVRRGWVCEAPRAVQHHCECLAHIAAVRRAPGRARVSPMKPPMKILHIRDTHEIGGPGKTILETYRAIDSSRFSLHLAVFMVRNQLAETPFVSAARELGMPVHVIRGYNQYDPRLIWRLAHLVRTLGIDVVHAHEVQSDVIAYLASKLHRVPTITTAHGWIATRRKARVLIALDKFVMRGLDRVIAVSGLIQRELIASGVQPDRVCLLHNAIVVERYVRTGQRGFLAELLGRPLSGPVIASIGRLSREKGHADLVDALGIVAAQGLHVHGGSGWGWP